MQTITLKARADSAGVLKLEIPTNLAGQEIEVVLVLQPVIAKAVDVDANGYPIGYFESTFGSLADEFLERQQPPYPDERDSLE